MKKILPLVLCLLLLFCVKGCDKNDDMANALVYGDALVPVVSTSQPSNVSSNSVRGSGNVISDGGAAITARGIAYGTSPNPNTSGKTAAAPLGASSFSVNITGLSPLTTYYMCAYASNYAGTAYGEVVSFITLPVTPNQWIHWDTGVSENSIGIGSENYFTVASRWTPSDLNAFQGKRISRIRFYINDRPNSIEIKIWQGSNQDNLIQRYSQSVPPDSERWIDVSLSNSYAIDTNLELWFGYEVLDPGQGAFPAGADSETAHDGKGNMVKLGAGEWERLSKYDLDGNWNLQAWVTSSGSAKDAEFIVLPGFEPLKNDTITSQFNADSTNEVFLMKKH